jgi:predicted Fe-S protein YdhL (DUF1289 family)
VVKSPCIDICEFDSKNGLCRGCKRTGFEIFNWMHFKDNEKKNILLKLKDRNITSKNKIRLVHT